MTLTVGSLFAGVEGLGMGFEQAGFKVAWQVEIDRDAVSVLERHYPDVLRVRDVRDAGAHNLTPVDVITFGSPCQGFSVAGRGEGLEDARSGLFGEAVRIIRELRPAFALWENVPGAYSANDGRDFGAVLAALAESGALDIAWRVLDAQWFGIPQRRRRIFLVADFGGERAAQVLFEPEGSSRDSQTSGAPWEGVAGDAEDGVGVLSIAYGFRPRENGYPPDISDFGAPAYCVDTFGEHAVGVLTASTGPIAGGVTASGAGGAGLPDVAFTLRHNTNGSGSSDNAWNTTYIPAVSGPLTAGMDSCQHNGQDDHADLLIADTVRSHPRPGSNSVGNLTLANSITASAGHHGHSSPRGDGSDNLITGIDWQQAGGTVEDGTPCLSTTRTPAVGGRPGMAVRRLTPRECERLMGWPDVTKTATIHVWNEAHSGENLRTAAHAGIPCRRSPGSASIADGSACRPPAKSASESSCTRHPDHAPHAVLSAFVDLGSSVVEISSPGGLLWRASNVDGNGWSDLRVPAADFARHAALISSILGQTTQNGRAASPPYTTPSTHQLSGSRCVVVSGQEIEESAVDVAPTASAARMLMSITSAVGASSPNFDSALTTLCCSVVHAIAGFIPERIRNTPSYDVELTIVSGWTQLRADGIEISDGPRYRMIGNGVATPVAAWIARRLRAAMEAS